MITPPIIPGAAPPKGVDEKGLLEAPDEGTDSDQRLVMPVTDKVHVSTASLVPFVCMLPLGPLEWDVYI